MNLDLKKFSDKFDLYLSESQSHRDSYAWKDRIKCDGLLFNCLWSIAGACVPILSARDGNGKWHRHPSFECYRLGQSGSEISRDMFDGVHLWSIVNRRGDVIEDLIAFGMKHNWIMGEGDISRTYFTPSMQATLYEIRYRLTGKTSWKRYIPRDWYRPIPFSIPASITGYQRHLQVLHIFCNCLMRNATEREIELLNYHRKSQDKNALYSAIYHLVTDKDFYEPICLLMDETRFPNDKLPTSLNYDSDYLWQRDQTSKDWQPRRDQIEFVLPAIDWLFAASITKEGLTWRI
jgi:hypothetical protein